jgi:hypothetical protein
MGYWHSPKTGIPKWNGYVCEFFVDLATRKMLFSYKEKT